VHVGPQPDVVSQIVAHIIRIVVNHDVIAVPEPVIDISKIGVCDREVETAKTKAVRIASTQPPNMSCTNGAGKVPVLPRTVKMVTRVMSFMAYPTIVFCVDMGCFRMAFRIAIRVRRWCRLVRNGARRWMRRSMSRRRTMSRNVPVAYAVFAAMLWRLRVLLRSVLLLIAVFLGQSDGATQENYAKESEDSEKLSDTKSRQKGMKVIHIFSPIKD
jgi:hypothetical protein